jgi:sulfotransferase
VFRQLEIEKDNYFKMQTVVGRCEMWAREDQPVGLAYNRVKDALRRGLGDRMHFVPYERFTRNPDRVMRDIYDFLEEDYYGHDFDHVEQVIWEDDRVHGMKLHDIRPKIEPQESKWMKVLGEEAGRRYSGLELW